MLARTAGATRRLIATAGMVASLVVALLMVTGCAQPTLITKEPSPPLAEPPILPRIEPPPLEDQAPITVELGGFLPGVRAHAPGHDGGRFFVALPPGAQESAEPPERVLATVVLPVAKAMGFALGPDDFALPRAEISQPRASLKGLAKAIEAEYARSPRLRGRQTQRLLDVFRERTKPDEETERALEVALDMTFARFREDIELVEIWYAFPQVVRASPDVRVPIEHTGVLATRRAGQTITTVRGSLLNQPMVGNRLVLSANAAVRAAITALGSLKGVEAVISSRPEDGPHLVLLPYGVSPDRRTTLRYTYRMILHATVQGFQGPLLLWLDADDGRIIKLEPLFGFVSATGSTYSPNAGTAQTTTDFEVDAAQGGAYTLKLANVASRLRFAPDASKEVSIPDNTGGSDSGFANFDQPPVNDAALGLCSKPGYNPAFQQINLFATFVRHRETMLAHGLSAPFPRWVLTPEVEATFCNAVSTMKFGACQGYYDPMCPDYVDPTERRKSYLNHAQDNTVIAHELGHNVTGNLTTARPSDWCDPQAGQSCPTPIGFSMFEDLADFWGSHLESTNCLGGWVAKNAGGQKDASRDCALHERLEFPRRLETPGDHFPETRARPPEVDFSGYVDGQIAGAALWEVRSGIRSKSGPAGTPQFGARAVRAVKKTGLVGSSPGRTDRGAYLFLYDLLLEMLAQWADSGSAGPAPTGDPTTNKVMAGFARAGIFAIPVQCLDGGACPAGQNAGEAVIEIDDNDASDDVTINNVTHPERDFLRLGDPTPPTFHVWTGPRYRFGATGTANLNAPRCNSQFMVEVSTDPSFQTGTVVSPWIPIPGPGTPAGQDCYGSWGPSPSDWTSLQAGGAFSRIYYRAWTRDAANANLRVSTAPANGLWTVAPPFAVLTPDGRSDY
jgi:hypothetical protein